MELGGILISVVVSLQETLWLVLRLLWLGSIGFGFLLPIFAGYWADRMLFWRAYQWMIWVSVPRDWAKAKIWCRRRAEQGDARAQTFIGLNHLHGRGVSKNTVAAAA